MLTNLDSSRPTKAQTLRANEAWPGVLWPCIWPWLARASTGPAAGQHRATGVGGGMHPRGNRRRHSKTGSSYWVSSGISSQPTGVRTPAGRGALDPSQERWCAPTLGTQISVSIVWRKIYLQEIRVKINCLCVLAPHNLSFLDKIYPF